MAEVFVSYQRKDEPKVRSLIDALLSHGIDVWWDQKILPGEAWEVRIEKELAQSKFVIVCWSKHSVVSENVKAEARHAKESNKLVQVLLDGTKPPLFFGERQGLDFSRWNGERGAEAIMSLLSVCGNARATAAELPIAAERPTAADAPPKSVAPSSGPGYLFIVVPIAALLIAGVARAISAANLISSAPNNVDKVELANTLETFRAYRAAQSSPRIEPAAEGSVENEVHDADVLEPILESESQILLRRIFTPGPAEPAILGGALRYLESFVGVPHRTRALSTGGIESLYTVGDCKLIVRSEGYSVSALGISDWSDDCSFDIGQATRLSDEAIPRDAKIGQIHSMISDAVTETYFSAECAGLCGNAYDPASIYVAQAPTTFSQMTLQIRFYPSAPYDGYADWNNSLDICNPELSESWFPQLISTFSDEKPVEVLYGVRLPPMIGFDQSCSE